MDIPQPPADPELKTIIDKLAQFVARNGSDFEQMTKQKQKDNPKFSFLFGGEFYNYYQYKVSSEQAILRQRQHVEQSHPHIVPSMISMNGSVRGIPSNPGQYTPHIGQHSQNYPIWSSVYAPNTMAPPPHHVPPSNLSTQQNLESLIIQQKQLQDQIQQSEQNLAAQHQVLMEQQNEDIEEAIKCAEEQRLSQLAHECAIDFLDVDQLLQPIIESCTKDSVSNGKSWIVSHGHLLAHQEFVCRYLLKKVTEPEASFNCKLHLIYLINDVLHHCVRKGADDLRRALEDAVVPMFCNAIISATPDQKTKLDKLLNLWESKHNYFSSLVIAKLKNPSETWAEYQASLITDNAHVITPITSNIQQLYERYQQQHQAFVAHATQQLQQLQQQQQQLDSQSTNVPLQMSGPPSHLPPPLCPETTFCHPPPSFNLPPPGYIPTNLPSDAAVLPQLPDITKPPPGYEPNEFKENLTPNVPYYELPAGLVVPLVKLEDCNYRPLDPDEIKLPPPTPPSERLLAAVEMFYSPPNHDRPIDSEGWEKLGLYEYFKAKNAARKKKEQDILEGLRQKSPSPPVVSGERSPEIVIERKDNVRNHSVSPVYTNNHPLSRSPSPPYQNNVYNVENTTKRLDESNRGHQLLKKMGWSGLGGLGVKEQGIEDPIRGGEVRDHVDQYRGVGVDLSDPFENFRKNKGMAFINRMRSRAEEKQ